eukprot:gene9438-12718_t
MEFASNSFPVRLSVTTFNVWGNNKWPERSTSLIQTLQTIRSDVYLLQEITPNIIEFLDKTLGVYKRVVDDKNPGWVNESNIYWNTDLLELVDHGFSELSMVDYPHRGFFWVRLSIKSMPQSTIFLSTVHFPWVGCPAEISTGINQRIPAATKVCEYFRRLVPPGEPAILGGDFNDDYHPLRVLNDEIGLMDVFESLDLPPPITHPVRPSDYEEEMRPNRTLDWILCSLPSKSRVVAAFAKNVRGGTYPPVSDHLPVVALFEFN